MIVSIDIDAQKTFTPLCPDELPVNEGHLIVEELNAHADLADKNVAIKFSDVDFLWLIDGG